MFQEPSYPVSNSNPSYSNTASVPTWLSSIRFVRESAVVGFLGDGGFLLALLVAVLGSYFAPEYVVSIVLFATLLAFVGETGVLRPAHLLDLQLKAQNGVSLKVSDPESDSERGLKAAVDVSRVFVFVAIFCLLVELVDPTGEEAFLLRFANVAVVAVPLGYLLSCST